MKLTKNKAIEFDYGKHKEWDYLGAHISATRKKDHAGVNLYLEIFGLYLDLSIYDVRHWDYDNDRWEVIKK